MAFDYPLKNRTQILDDPTQFFSYLVRDIRDSCLSVLFSHDNHPDLLVFEKWCPPRLVHVIPLDSKYTNDTEMIVLRNGDVLILAEHHHPMVRLDPRTGRETILHPNIGDVGVQYYYDIETDTLTFRDYNDWDHYIISDVSLVFTAEDFLAQLVRKDIDPEAIYGDISKYSRPVRVAGWPDTGVLEDYVPDPRFPDQIRGQCYRGVRDFCGRHLPDPSFHVSNRQGYYGGYWILCYWRTDHPEIEFHQCVE